MKDNRELIEEKSSEFEMLRHELENIDAENQEINSRMAEFRSAIEIISQVKKAKPDQEIVMPLSEGLMLKVYIKDPSKALIGIGNNIIIEKNSEECDKYIKERIDEADSLLIQLSNEANNVTDKLRKLESELISLTNEAKEENIEKKESDKAEKKYRK
jgi:prefoldin alpha subunit